MQRQLNVAPPISLLVLVPVIIRGLGLPMLFVKTLGFFQALKMKVIVHMQNSRWR